MLRGNSIKRGLSSWTNSGILFQGLGYRYYSSNYGRKMGSRVHRKLIAISGPDTLKFLNGLVTNTLNEQNVVFAAFLNAKGRVLADSMLYPVTESRIRPAVVEAADIPAEFRQDKIYLAEVDSRMCSDIVSMMNSHKLRAKVHVSALDEFSVFSVWDDQSPRGLSNSLSRIRDEHDIIAFNDPRAPGFGVRIISGHKDFALGSVYDKVEDVNVEDYKIRRYLYGIPEGSQELQSGSALPLESCIDYMKGVNFDKGCYVGQELTIRTHHNGVVRKRVLPVTLSDGGGGDSIELKYDAGLMSYDSSQLIGSSIYNFSDREIVGQISDMINTNNPSPFGSLATSSSSRRSSRPSGTIIGAIGNIGLALVRLDHFAQPKAKFGISVNEGEINVRGFVPFWWP